MTIINSARNPKWADYAQTRINIEVDFDHLDDEYVEFTADPNDAEAHGVDIYNRAVSGEFGPVADFTVPDNVVGDEAMRYLRQLRTFMLEDTDYIEMPTKWAALTTEQQASWSQYRNALRDLPANSQNAELHWNDSYTDLTTWVNVVWPIKPE